MSEVNKICGNINLVIQRGGGGVYSGYLSKHLISNGHECSARVRKVVLARMSPGSSSAISLFSPQFTRNGSCQAETQGRDQQISGVHTVRYSSFPSGSAFIEG